MKNKSFKNSQEYDRSSGYVISNNRKSTSIKGSNGVFSVKSLKDTVKRWRITGFVSRANKLAMWIKGYEKGKCTRYKLVEVYYQIQNM